MEFRGEDYGDDSTSMLAQINMIPLIDVMLVLLIVFMLSAPLSFSSIEVRLPSGASAPQDPKLKENAFLEVVVSRDGEVFFEEESQSLEKLVDNLRAKSEKDSTQRLLVRADEAVVYARVMAVMNAARRAGMNHISLVMKEEDSFQEEGP